MTFPHSTPRILPLLCSSSVTLSEIMRLCVQPLGGFIGRDFGACSDSLNFTVHLWNAKYVLLADVRHHDPLASAIQNNKQWGTGPNL
jgi:hypothetical protein